LNSILSNIYCNICK